MGIFNALHGKGGKKNGRVQPKSLRSYSGTCFEVFSQDDELLFVGNLLIQSGQVELHQTAGSDLADARFAKAHFLPVTLRGFDAREKTAVHMKAVISRLSERIWTIEEANVVGMENDRAFFRQDTSFRGTAVQMEKEDAEPCLCYVRNVSAGGVCIQTQDVFEVGDKIMVRFDILPGQSLAQRCVVRRVSRRKTSVYSRWNDYYEYGCQFVGLSQNAEDQIVRLVTELQIQQRKWEREQ